MESGDALRTGMMSGLAIFAVSVTFLVLAMRYLPGDEASRLERARAAGEKV
jgi:multisubunit Na+/H+ antiporter MnhB subunit